MENEPIPDKVELSLPESTWEKEYREYEENHMGRPKRRLITHCTDCLPDIECFNVSFASHVRLVNFPGFGVKTFSLDSIDECMFKKE